MALALALPAALSAMAFTTAVPSASARPAPRTTVPRASTLPASVRFRVEFLGAGTFDRTAGIKGHIACAPSLAASEVDHAAFRWDFIWEVTVHPRVVDDKPLIVPKSGSLVGQAVHNVTGPDAGDGLGCTPHDATCTETVPFSADIAALDQTDRQHGALVNRAFSAFRSVANGAAVYSFAATVNPDRSALDTGAVDTGDGLGCDFLVDGSGPNGLHDYGNPLYYSEQDIASTFRDPIAPQPFTIPAADLSRFGLQELPVSSKVLKAGDVVAAPGEHFDCSTQLPGGAGTVTCSMGQSWQGRVRITKIA